MMLFVLMFVTSTVCSPTAMTVLGRTVLCALALCQFGTAQWQVSNDGIRAATSNRETSRAGVTLPSIKKCGKRAVRFKRIVGGSDLTHGFFPWIAALGYRRNARSRSVWLCTGTLVTERHIITSALCVSAAPKNFTLSVARLGDLDLNDNINDGATPVEYEVESSIVHPYYNFRLIPNDIAIVKLKMNVTFRSDIRPICLPVDDEIKNKNFTEVYADITGLGDTQYPGGRLTSRLQNSNVRVWDQQACRNKFSNNRKTKRLVIDNKVICAGGDGKDACNDFGGPLTVTYSLASRKPYVNYFLYGVFSFGYQCGTTGYPGVYTRVSAFMDWILQNLN